MKIVERRVIDDLAVSEERCLGAAFCSYTFDPAFFEEQVLGAVLRLRSDPEEQAAAFLDEARRALVETPVAVLVDAGARSAGRRLPYDLLLVRRRTFHPKLALALYETHARLVVGSANLTRPGFGENLEMLFARTLPYDDAEARATLEEADRFLARSADLATTEGTQLALVREALRRRIGPPGASSPKRRDHGLLSSFDGPILDQLFAMMPEDARIVQVGVLAPFYEQDDLEAGADEGIDSVLLSLCERRRTDGLVVDLGTAWSDAPLAAEPGEAPPPEAVLGRLCGWRFTEETEAGRREHIEYLTPTALGPRSLSYADAHRAGKRIEREVFEDALERRALFPVRPPTLHLPATVVGKLREAHELRLWGLPSASLDDRGRVQRRELHAKLLLVATVRRGQARTYVLMGSPNASRGALLRGVDAGGNVELAVLAVVNGHYGLVDALPSIVALDPEATTLVERPVAPAEPDPGAWIADAVYDAALHTLSVTWAEQASSPLGAWQLRYEERELLVGEGRPSEPTLVTPFDLVAATAELEIVSEGRTASVPIRVADLAQLPLGPALADLGLRELLALLGRRVGRERITTLLADRGPAGTAPLLEAIFGEGFGPVDVFKAWWGLAHDLEEPLSVPGFRMRLRGPLGAEAAWMRMREAAGTDLGADDAWVYGAELLRTLRRVEVPDGPDRSAKRALLGEFCAELGASLDEVRPSAEGRPWLEAVTAFYAGEKANA